MLNRAHKLRVYTRVVLVGQMMIAEVGGATGALGKSRLGSTPPRPDAFLGQYSSTLTHPLGRPPFFPSQILHTQPHCRLTPFERILGQPVFNGPFYLASIRVLGEGLC